MFFCTRSVQQYYYYCFMRYIIIIIIIILRKIHEKVPVLDEIFFKNQNKIFEIFMCVYCIFINIVELDDVRELSAFKIIHTDQYNFVVVLGKICICFTCNNNNNNK